MSRWRSKEEALKTLHEERSKLSDDHRSRLEEQLTAEYQELYSPQRRWKMVDARNPRTRFAMVAIVLILVGVGACSTPTTSEVDMGQKLSFTLSPEAAANAADKMPSELANFVGGLAGVDEVSVSVSEEYGGPTTIDLLVFGQDVDGPAVIRSLTEAYPRLADADVDAQNLTGRIRESLASKVGRTLFSLNVGGGSAEEIRNQILSQLADQGFDGSAQVDVSKDGDMTTIGVQLDTDDGENITQEKIEIITDGEPTTIEVPAGAEADADAVEGGKKKTVEVKKKG